MMGASPEGTVRKRRKLLSFYHRIVAENLRVRALRSSRVAAKKQEVKALPKRKAAKKPFDVRQLWRLALWSVTAGCAFGLAVLASRGEPGSERFAALIATLHGQTAPPPFDAKVETKKLADALRGLSAENEMLRSRLAAVENHEQRIDNVTGSLSKEIEVVKAEAEAPRPAETPPTPTTPDVTGAVPSPAPAPPTAQPAPPVPAPLPTPPPASSSATPKQYGIDIGSAVSIQALRARWVEIRTAHPQAFQGLTPTVVMQSGRSELRLVLGPLPNPDAAAKLCASLLPYRIACQPTGFDGQHVALQ
jgi:cell division septation protein DedD